LRSNMEGYGGKTHYTNSQNSNTTASSSRVLYHLQLLLQEASSETSGYTLIWTQPFHFIITLSEILENLIEKRERERVCV